MTTRQRIFRTTLTVLGAAAGITLAVLAIFFRETLAKFPIPVLAPVIFGLGGIGAIVCTALALTYTVIRARKRAAWDYIIRPGLATVMAAALTVGSLAPTVTSIQTLTASTPSNSDSSSTTSTSEPEKPDPEPEEINEKYYVNLGKEDLQTWITEKLGDVDLGKLTLSKNSFPSQHEERVEANKKALAKYYPEGGIKRFDDPVEYPMASILEAVYGENQSWQKMSDEERKAFMAKQRKNIYLTILVNPVVADMWVQSLKDAPELVELNASWLPETIKYFEGAYKRTENPVGNSYFLKPTTEIDPQLVMNEDYILNAIRVCDLLDKMWVDVDEPVTTATSVAHWSLPALATDANMVRTVKISEKEEQESLPALLFEVRYKSGHLAYRWGENLFDQRVEKFDTTEAEDKPQPPVTPPSTSTPPSSTSTTTPQNPPKTIKYKLVISYLEDGTEKELAKPYQAELTANSKYSVASPVISGYHLKFEDDAVISDVLDGDHWIDVYYVKDDVKKTDFKLTINYLEYGTNKVLHKAYEATLKTGTRYDVPSPTPDSSHVLRNASDSRVTGVINGRDVNLTVYYDRLALLRIYYRDYDTNTLLNSHKATYRVGASFNVQHPQFQGYTVVGNTTSVSGTMTANGVERTVYYKKDIKEVKLTFKFIRSEIHTEVAAPLTRTYKVGEYYNIPAPADNVMNYVPEVQFCTGYAPNHDDTIIIWYNKPKTGDNGSEDDAPIGGGGTIVDDPGPGSEQPSQPPIHDYDPGQDTTTPSSSNTDPLPADGDNGDDDSSGKGGNDHPITGPGENQNPNPPPTDPVDPDPTIGDNGGEIGGTQPPNDPIKPPVNDFDD